MVVGRRNTLFNHGLQILLAVVTQVVPWKII